VGGHSVRTRSSFLQNSLAKRVHSRSFFGPDSGLSLKLAETGSQTAGKLPATEANLYCSLEELYRGCSKKLKIVKQRLNLDGKTTTPEDSVITIEVGAGWKAGTKIRFQNQGDEGPNATPGDVVFTVREKPHPRFTRNKHDLVHVARVSLRDALTGCTVNVETLDGRVLPIAVNDVVTSKTVKVVEGEGMPITKRGARGNLLIQFDLVFPDQLTVEQKNKLKKILPA